MAQKRSSWIGLELHPCASSAHTHHLREMPCREPARGHAVKGPPESALRPRLPPNALGACHLMRSPVRRAYGQRRASGRLPRMHSQDALRAKLLMQHQPSLPLRRHGLVRPWMNEGIQPAERASPLVNAEAPRMLICRVDFRAGKPWAITDDHSCQGAEPAGPKRRGHHCSVRFEGQII